MMWLMVALGAAVGAPARYLLDRAFRPRRDAAFPWGTLVANLIAAFVLGVATGAASRLSPEVAALVTTGLCGALSTFSTFSLDTVELLACGERSRGWANVAVTVLAGLGAVAAGWLLGAALSG